MGFEEGMQFSREGNYEAAINEFRDVVKNDMTHHKAWNALGVTLTHLGRYDEAEGCFAHALDLQPEEPVYLKNQRINAKKQGGLRANSSQSTSNMRERGPSRVIIAILAAVFVCMILGGIALLVGGMPGGGSYIASIFGQAHQNSDALTVPETAEYSRMSTSGFEKLSESNPDVALQNFDQAIVQDPRPPRAWTGKGYALISLGRYEEAVLAFDEALIREPGYQNAVTGRDIAAEALGR